MGNSETEKNSVFFYFLVVFFFFRGKIEQSSIFLKKLKFTFLKSSFPLLLFSKSDHIGFCFSEKRMKIQSVLPYFSRAVDGFHVPPLTLLGKYHSRQKMTGKVSPAGSYK